MKRIFFVLLLIYGAFLMSSCKKTIGFEREAENLIKDFKVKVSDGYLYGAIDNEKGMVTVYLPYYYELSFLEPEIKVSSSAKLLTEINPVSVTDKGVRYAVSDDSGNIKSYALNIVLQKMGKLSVNELSSASVTKEIPLNAGFSLSGFFNTIDRDKIKLSLIDAAGKETALIGNSPSIYKLTSSGTAMSLSGLLMNADFLPGLYRIKMKVYDDSVVMVNPVKVRLTQPAPVLLIIGGAAGSNFTIVTSNSTTSGLKSMKITASGIVYDCKIVSQTLTSFTIKIPENLPMGNYPVSVAIDFDGWGSFTGSTYADISL